MASPCVSPAVPSLEVARLEADTAASSQQSAMLVKLTEECVAAINNAHRTRAPIKMRMDPQGGVIEIGAGERVNKFRFAVQQISGPPSDAVVFDRLKGYRSTATLQSKLQVQATDKSFAETREKAQKLAQNYVAGGRRKEEGDEGCLAEEERRRAMKDVSRQRRDQRSITVKRATNQVAIGAQRPSPSSSNFSKPHTAEFSKNAHYKLPNGVQNGSNSSAGTSGARSFIRAEILRKPLRKRIIHLVVIGKFHTTDDVIAQLKKDSVNGTEDASFEVSKARDIIEEVSETGKDTGRLQLKPSFFSEVDPRWPGFNSDEKASVRKLLSGNNGSSTNFAPTRKSGMAPPQAPITSHATTVSPEAIPTPPTLSGQSKAPAAPPANRKTTSPKIAPSSGNTNNKKLLPSPPNNNSTNSTSNPLDDLLPSATSTMKRKAHAPSTAVPDKRARQQSLSPPEDPSSANPASVPPPQKTNGRSERPAQNGGENNGANANNGVSPTAAPIPSRDWSKEFPEVRSLAEAEKYYNMFIAEYPQYLNYFNYLSSVASEFSDLEKQFNETAKNTREHEKIERDIQAKYSQYQRDSEFLQIRQKHADLRAKLEVLKKRIGTWEANQDSNELAHKNELDCQSRVADNLLVM